MNPLKYAQMIKYLTRAKKEKPDLPDVFPASKAPTPAKTQNVQETEAVNQFVLRNPRKDMAGGGFIKQLYGGIKGLQQGKIEKELINKYRGQGMDLLEAINKANPEANQIVKNRKLKAIQDKLNETNVLTDDYVKLIDEEIKLNDPELFKDIIKFKKNNRSDLVDKMRALRHPDWAEANFGEDYLDVLQQRQSRAIKQMMDDIDPNVKERTVVDDIDDMNQANIDEFFGRKKNADGGRIEYALGSTDNPITPQNNLIDMSLEESTTGPSGFPMTAGVSVLPKLYDTVPKAVDLIESGATTAAKAKKIVTDFLGQRQPYTGATKIGESTPKDFTPEKNFLEVLKSYMDKYTGGSVSQAAKDLRVSRNVLKGIRERINLQETGQRVSSGLGKNPYTKVTKIEEPIDGLQYKEMTTLMKNYPNKFKILRGGENKFLDQESLGHYLGVKFTRDKKGIRTGIGKFQYDQLGNMLRKLKVKKNKIGEFNVDDAINKFLTKTKTKLVKGQRVRDIGKDRYTIEKNFDPELLLVRAQLTDRVSKRSQGLDVYLPNAVDDIGHPFSLSKSVKKYKNLFKDSNMNSINTLVYQDHKLNTQLHKITGFEGRYEKMFDTLKNLQNKKITPKIQEQLLDIKNQMNANYNNYIETLSNPQKVKQLLTKNKLNFTDDFIKYLSSQTDRIQKIDINVPKIGDTFKSKDIFVDMSTVNPKYIMGYVNQINPKAKKFKDLSMSEQAIFKQNALNQNADIVAEYYKKAKYPIDDVEAVKETIKMDFAKGGPVNIDLTMPIRTPFRYGKLAKLSAKRGLYGAFTPTGLATLFTPDLDLTKAENRISLAAEAAFLPELVKSSIGATKGMKNRSKQKLIQRLLNLGLKTPTALRLARVASPIGIASLGAEGLYQAGKYTKKRIKELKEMSPEERQELRSEGARQAFDPFMAAGGGIAKEAGDSSGPPPVKGPNSQGLLSLKNRVRNY